MSTTIDLLRLKLLELKNAPLSQTAKGAAISQVLLQIEAEEAKEKATPQSVVISDTDTTTQPLTDTQLRASDVKVSLDSEVVAISVSSLPLPTGAATSAKQDVEAALITALNSLIETNNTIVQRLEQIASAMNSGQPALRTIPIASVSTAVTGSVTATVASTVVSSLTNFGTGIPATEMANDMNNMTAILANINNVSVT